MKFTCNPAPLPSMQRLRTLHAKYPGTSVLRKLEYEKLSSISLHGLCLDIGGGSNSKYRDILPNNIEIFSVNIDSEFAPTHLINPNEAFPFEDNSFDCAISLNTLEHIFDSKFTIQEIFRVLKPGAMVHISVPWMFGVHGHPDDFFRATPSWWRETMAQAGYSNTQLWPLTWGRYTAAYTVCAGKFKKLNLFSAYIKDIMYARKKAFRNSTTYSGRRGEYIAAVSVGWFISSTK